MRPTIKLNSHKHSKTVIAKEAIEWLESPKRLNGQKEDLRSLRGEPGAVKLMTQEILKMIISIQKK